ncbi:hypothetical protein HG531_013431 [Fusarium graminearum]|nr:hypothetical protein HG531_013431 [Fusarium graminearum]
MKPRSLDSSLQICYTDHHDHNFARGAVCNSQITKLLGGPHEILPLGPRHISYQAGRQVLPKFSGSNQDDIVLFSNSHVTDIGCCLNSWHQVDISKSTRDLKQIVESPVTRNPSTSFANARSFGRLSRIMLASQHLMCAIGLNHHRLRIADICDIKFRALEVNDGCHAARVEVLFCEYDWLTRVPMRLDWPLLRLLNGNSNQVFVEC